MGSIITLSVGLLEVDWGKNNHFVNHSKLFLPADNQRVTKLHQNRDEDDASGELTEDEENEELAYMRSLESIVPRLELLGFNLDNCRKLYDEHSEWCLRHEDEYVDSDFEYFAKTLATIEVGQMRSTEPGDYDRRTFTIRDSLKASDFALHFPELNESRWDEATFFETIDPYIILRLLAENPRNLKENVVWRYHDVVEGGWVEEEEIFEGLADSDLYLIVTEGKSDSAILKKSLKVLRPDIADFFTFIDMGENYPFTGTGNLANFCQGLARIRIQNKVLVIFDNDTAGKAAYEKVRGQQLPPSMCITLLPSLPDFESFPTLGPSGASTENINSKAVAIELYLDLTHATSHPPSVRWTSYDKKLDQYQGELVDKDALAQDFIKRKSLGESYDMSKLKRLWNHLVDVCMAARPG